MTPRQVAIVQDSFLKLVPISELVSDIFYDQLFLENPDLRPLFPTDMKVQKIKLMKALSAAVAHLHEIDVVVGSIRELGAKHKAYGVEDEHYDAVGAALIYTLKTALSEIWADELEEAWVKTYDLVATTMKEGVPDQ
ncbi:globin domain-containing protein [uncultured Cohaesibacter sp.]|uniref:globin domain-containing protein n=1 Tax=uncultured Cohaesibacter sp. TaxID=1002546 RepID=UPI0029C6B1FF|nr:globin domain-containing protein [uncultured Cohaesibacter sp.]